jgi:prevent-host-death family protein
MDIPAAQFKAECLKLMDKVAKTRQPIIITKHGRPVAQLAPVSMEPRSLFGYMKGSIRIEGDVVAPIGVEWDALSEHEGPRLRTKAATTRSRRK